MKRIICTYNFKPNILNTSLYLTLCIGDSKWRHDFILWSFFNWLLFWERIKFFIPRHTHRWFTHCYLIPSFNWSWKSTQILFILTSSITLGAYMHKSRSSSTDPPRHNICIVIAGHSANLATEWEMSRGPVNRRCTFVVTKWQIWCLYWDVGFTKKYQESETPALMSYCTESWRWPDECFIELGVQTNSMNSMNWSSKNLFSFLKFMFDIYHFLLGQVVIPLALMEVLMCLKFGWLYLGCVEVLFLNVSLDLSLLVVVSHWLKCKPIN